MSFFFKKEAKTIDACRHLPMVSRCSSPIRSQRIIITTRPPYKFDDTTMATKLQKTIERTQEKIQAGQFYEAHQAVRTIAARYIRQKAYPEAIEVLYTATKQLLDANEPGSASDLTLYLIQVYNTAEVKVDNESKARLTQILQGFKPTEPTLKTIAHEINQWSSKHGEYPYGDAELHHVLGCKFVEACEAYEAEKCLLLGTKDSASVFTKFLYQWYCENDDVETAPLYLSRAVLGYLAIQNLRDAKVACALFISLLQSDNKVALEPITKDDDTTIYVCEQAPLLTFLQLLILACQYQNADMFKRLTNRYNQYLQNTTAFQAPLAKIAKLFCNIEPPRQANMLQDLMGSLFA